MHQLIETRRESDNRKVNRCTICGQEWTYIPKIICPGVPVVPWNSNEAGNLRTRTQAKKEHYLLPENAKRVAVLRLNSDPWYISLYDVSQCEQRLPTEKQRQSMAQREQTLRERYGCRLCSKRYLKEDARAHINGVCVSCRAFAGRWNNALQWARTLLENPPDLLLLTTEPARRSMCSISGDYWRITGYQTIDPVTGAQIAEKQLSQPEDYTALADVLQLAQIAGAEEKPLFLFSSWGDQSLCWSQLHANGHLVDWSWLKLTTTLPTRYLKIPLADRDWCNAPEETFNQPIYYRKLCESLGLTVEAEASVASMLRLVICHLASKEAIAL